MTKPPHIVPLISGAAFLLVTILGAYFVFTLFHYTDLPHKCLIKTNAVTFGASTTVMRRALAYLRTNDPPAYKNTCAHVDTITEKPCVTSDPSLAGEGVDVRVAACYILGSKTIYLKHEEVADVQVVKEKASAIAKFAEKSARYHAGVLR